MKEQELALINLEPETPPVPVPVSTKIERKTHGAFYGAEMMVLSRLFLSG